MSLEATLACLPQADDAMPPGLAAPPPTSMQSGAAAFGPPYSPAGTWSAALRENGYAVVDPTDVPGWIGAPDLPGMAPSWNDLPPDDYLKDGGRYRRRRHACFEVEAGALHAVAHRAHWQPVQYNALHGGMARWFAPMEPTLIASESWRALMLRIAEVASNLRGEQRWFIEAHQFRIDTADGIGRPTPEGAHRDGVDLVLVVLIDRHRIRGGETRVFEANGRRGERFTMTEPWTCLLLDDARVIHESTPIQSMDEGATGWRDTLVVTCRAGGFQSDPENAA